MKYPLRILFASWVFLACAMPLCGQEVSPADEQSVDDPSPNQRFAFLRIHHPDPDPQRTCDLIEKASGKVLLRVVQSDEGQDRLGVQVLWSPDSERFALLTTYNHFGAELSMYLRTGGTFRKLTLPNISEPEIPNRIKHSRQWKWTGIGSASADHWEKDGTLTVSTQSTLQSLNSSRVLTSRRTVVLGISKSGKVSILKSRRKVTAHDEND